MRGDTRPRDAAVSACGSPHLSAMLTGLGTARTVSVQRPPHADASSAGSLLLADGPNVSSGGHFTHAHLSMT